jgi:hypothetical protein
MPRVFYIHYKNKSSAVFAVFFCFLLLATVVCIAYGGGQSENQSAYSPPIKGVASDDGAYSVTVIINQQSWNDVRMVLEACEGYGIVATCFMSADWIIRNKDNINKICESHIPALLITENFSRTSRTDVMAFVATLNDKFMTLTGNYPKYVRYDGEDEGCLSSVLSAYGQYYISAENVLSQTAVQIRSGGITEIHPCGNETLFAFAKTVATAVSNSLKPVPLSDMLYPIGNEVNANGYQSK